MLTVIVIVIVIIIVIAKDPTIALYLRYFIKRRATILVHCGVIHYVFGRTGRSRGTIQLGSGTIQSLGAAAEEELSYLIDEPSP